MTATAKLPTEKTIEGAMSLFEAQAVLFAPRPNRLALQGLELPAPSRQSASVNVWRNHAFEPLVPLTTPYFAFCGWHTDFRLGGYDDSLMFVDRQEADAELLWLDSDRFLARMAFDEWLPWLEGRLHALRSMSKAPVIIATWLDEAPQRARLQSLVDALPAVYFADLGSVCSEAGVPLKDSRSAALAGTPVANAAQVQLARELACHWLPGALLPPVKAVALDLDHTLHAGVLGEEGIQGVQLSPGHEALQNYVKGLQQRGVFVALVSRNERADVEALFAQRQDYPLRWEDFSATEVSWGDKAAAVERIAKALRIAADAVLFVDDNPGELASVTMQLPSVHAVYAHPDATLTCRAIHYYPGLWRWKVESDDAKRIQDLKANAERDALAEHATDPAEYFRSLQVSLVYRIDPVAQLTRLADLCNKTNQFNLAMRRFNQAEVAERLERRDACIASVQLSDRLSDSGVIAVIVAERQGERLLVEELCVSCRAMGRQLEDTIILEALRRMPIFAGCQELAFRVAHGPRNQPALDWLARLLGCDDHPEAGLHNVPAQFVRDFTPAAGVTLNQE